MKVLFLPLICVGALGLTSCGLLRTVTQVPIRTLQTLTRTVGVGIEQSEIESQEKGVSEVKIEIDFKPQD